MHVTRVALIVYAVVFLFAIPAENARILAVETIAGKSHWNFMSSVLRSLTEAGHSVTVFTQFPDGHRENYTEVNTAADFTILVEYDLVNLLKIFEPISFMLRWVQIARNQCDMVYKNHRLGEIINGTGHSDFDLIIVEPLGAIDCVSSLAGALNLPIIYTIPSPMLTLRERAYTGHASHPASVSNILSNWAVMETFGQRLTNTVYNIFFSVFTTVYEQALKLTDPKPYSFAPTVSPSIVFQNSHFISEMAKPVTSNLINIGGIHLKPAMPIPKVIKHRYNLSVEIQNTIIDFRIY